MTTDALKEIRKANKMHIVEVNRLIDILKSEMLRFKQVIMKAIEKLPKGESNLDNLSNTIDQAIKNIDRTKPKRDKAPEIVDEEAKRAEKEVDDEGKKVDKELDHLVNNLKKAYTEIRNLGLLNSQTIEEASELLTRMENFLDFESKGGLAGLDKNKINTYATFEKDLKKFQKQFEPEAKSVWWGLRSLSWIMRRVPKLEKEIVAHAETLQSTDPENEHLKNLVTQTKELEQKSEFFFTQILGLRKTGEADKKTGNNLKSVIDKVINLTDMILQEKKGTEQRIEAHKDQLSSLIKVLKKFLDDLKKLYKIERDTLSSIEALEKLTDDCVIYLKRYVASKSS